MGRRKSTKSEPGIIVLITMIFTVIAFIFTALAYLIKFITKLIANKQAVPSHTLEILPQQQIVGFGTVIKPAAHSPKNQNDQSIIDVDPEMQPIDYDDDANEQAYPIGIIITFIRLTRLIMRTLHNRLFTEILKEHF